MRFIITTRRDDDNPRPDAPFDPEMFKAYMRFNEELFQAGVLVASEGLLPGHAARVAVSGGKRKVVDGPYSESKELVGGFYIIDVPSIEDAKQWALRAPFGMGTDDVLEIRRLTGSADLPKEIIDMAREVAPGWVASIQDR